MASVPARLTGADQAADAAGFLSLAVLDERHCCSIPAASPLSHLQGADQREASADVWTRRFLGNQASIAELMECGRASAEVSTQAGLRKSKKRRDKGGW